MNLKRLRTPALVATAIVATAGISGAVGASAAVHYLVLGTKNSTTTTTTVTDTTGTPLSLAARSGYAPLAVNSTKAVSKLNSDYLDGYHASSFAKVTGKTGIIIGDSPNLATCPSGTQLTGGGGVGYGGLLWTGPSPDDLAHTWEIIDAQGQEQMTFAVCYNPSGAVPGAVSSAALKSKTSKLQQRALATRKN